MAHGLLHLALSGLSMNHTKDNMRPQLEQDIGEATDADYSNPFIMPVGELIDYLMAYAQDEMIGLDEIEVFWQWKEEQVEE
jgi:hypothetical protein